MKIGDVIESAIWITGDEGKVIRKQYEQDVRHAIEDVCEESGVKHGPVTFTEKHPMDDRVPTVPDDVQGTRVRLLVAEAEIIGFCLKSIQGSFVENLDRADVMKLREITRNKCRRYLSDDECDQIIEQIGPEAALDTLRVSHH